MLHGEHGTCGHLDSTKKWYLDDRIDYSRTGKCPTDYRVTPNHLGYDYIGSRLATQGYVVISINSNRGINQTPEFAADPDPGLVVRRGRLILRHLQQWGTWNKTADRTAPAFFKPLKGKLDFTRVSLFGHSRGGDAIVSAYYLFKGDVDTWRTKRLPLGTKIVALAAIAPTDTQTQKNVASQIPLGGVAYGVLLPMCDGDVVRLSGVHFYDRSVNYFPDLTGNFRATFATWGAEHNAYNTEWHTQDAYDLVNHKTGTQTCPGQTKLFATIGTSQKQQTLGLYFTEAVIRARSGSASYGQLLNPTFQLPTAVKNATRVDRGYFPGTPIGGGLRLVRFDGVCADKLAITTATGASASCGQPPEHQINASNNNDPTNTWIARVTWGPPTKAVQTARNSPIMVNPLTQTVK
jgi:hypothetical protein